MDTKDPGPRQGGHLSQSHNSLKALLQFDEPGGNAAFEINHPFLHFFSLVRKLIAHLRTVYASPKKLTQLLSRFR